MIGIRTSRLRSRAPQRTRQRGIVLVVAVIVLIGMTLAAYAMLRLVGSGMGIAGNISFRQNATMAADAGVEEALKWVRSASPAMKQQRAGAPNFYYPTWETTFKPYEFVWDDTTSSTELSVPGGNVVRYVVHRMCSSAGDIGSSGVQNCVLVPKKDVAGAAGCNPDEDPACGTGNYVYFRVTARVTGPRNTVSYIQVLMF